MRVHEIHAAVANAAAVTVVKISALAIRLRAAVERQHGRIGRQEAAILDLLRRSASPCRSLDADRVIGISDPAMLDAHPGLAHMRADLPSHPPIGKSKHRRHLLYALDQSSAVVCAQGDNLTLVGPKNR